MKLKASGDFLKKWAVRFWWNIGENVALTGEGTSLSPAASWKKKPSQPSESGDRHFLEDSSSNCVLTCTHRDTPKLSLWWQKVWIVWWCRMQPRLLEGFAQSAWYQRKNNSGLQAFLQGWFYSEKDLEKSQQWESYQLKNWFTFTFWVCQETIFKWALER